MASRLGLLPPSSLETQQKELYADFERQLESKPLNFVYSKDEEGCLLGPAGALIHDPDMFQHCLGLYKAVSQKLSKSQLPRYIEEIASLVVGSRTHAAYEIYAHSRSSGFPQEYLDDIRNGDCPVEFGDKGAIAFQVATELGSPGSLSETTWQKSVDVLGVEGTSALVQCVGFYTFLSTISNGFDIQLPKACVSQASSARSARSSICSDNFE